MAVCISDFFGCQILASSLPNSTNQEPELLDLRRICFIHHINVAMIGCCLHCHPKSSDKSEEAVVLGCCWRAECCATTIGKIHQPHNLATRSFDSIFTLQCRKCIHLYWNASAKLDLIVPKNIKWFAWLTSGTVHHDGCTESVGIIATV